MWVWQHCLIDSVKRKRILLPPSATATGTSSLSDSICSLSASSASPKQGLQGKNAAVHLGGSKSVGFLSGLIADVKPLFGLALFLLAESFSGTGIGPCRLTGWCKPQLRGL